METPTTDLKVQLYNALARSCRSPCWVMLDLYLTNVYSKRGQL